MSERSHRAEEPQNVVEQVSQQERQYLPKLGRVQCTQSLEVEQHGSDTHSNERASPAPSFLHLTHLKGAPSGVHLIIADGTVPLDGPAGLRGLC